MFLRIVTRKNLLRYTEWYGEDVAGMKELFTESVPDL